MRHHRHQDGTIFRLQRSTVCFTAVLLLLLASSLYLNLVMLPKHGREDEADSEALLNKSVLVFYFPQFYELDENIRSWVKGFTDLTLVKQVRRSRVGQPVIRPGERSSLALWAYNQEWESHRRFQGNLAGAYGIDGFVMMHYWFDGHAVMDAPVQGRLKDGQPAIPYCLYWVNEDWPRKDGGAEMLLRQTYNQSSWIQHLEYLLPFFMDPGYIKVSGKPLFAVYRASDIPEFSRMVAMWNQQLRAMADGFPGLHIVQILGSKWTEQSHELAIGSAGFIEHYPDIFNGGQWSVSKMLSTFETNPRAQRYYGVSAAWDNTPRHLTDDRGVSFPSHPSVFKYLLQQNLARTKPGGFVFVNAWNEWGDGAAIEPSIEWGRRWLEAVRQAKTDARLGHFMDLDSRGHPVKVRLPPAGVSPSASPFHNHGSVCIIVRTFQGHETAMFNIRQFISTLESLNTKSWDAHFVNTDAQPYLNLGSIISSYGDKRLKVIVPPSNLDRTYSSKLSAYHIVDWAISAYCDASKYKWMLVTNADNWYAPDALNYMPSNFDIILMNFYGRYTIINEMRFGNGTAIENCCERLGSQQCFFSAPRIGFVDLGAVLFNLDKYKNLGITFMQFTGACGGSGCHDGALIQALVEQHGWSYDNHELGVCSLYHNPSPQSCTRIGGVYFDSMDFTKADCYDIGSLPIPAEQINWDAWINSNLACVCEDYDTFSRLFAQP